MVKVVGIQEVDYVNKKNQPVKGVTLHCVLDDDRVKGQAVESYFISARNEDCYEVARGIALGANIAVYYNRFGYVDSVQVVK